MCLKNWFETKFSILYKQFFDLLYDEQRTTLKHQKREQKPRIPNAHVEHDHTEAVACQQDIKQANCEYVYASNGTAAS